MTSRPWLRRSGSAASFNAGDSGDNRWAKAARRRESAPRYEGWRDIVLGGFTNNQYGKDVHRRRGVCQLQRIRRQACGSFLSTDVSLRQRPGLSAGRAIRCTYSLLTNSSRTYRWTTRATKGRRVLGRGSRANGKQRGPQRQNGGAHARRMRSCTSSVSGPAGSPASVGKRADHRVSEPSGET